MKKHFGRGTGERKLGMFFTHTNKSIDGKINKN